MKVSIVAAVACDMTIGDKGKIPWRLPPDMTRFQRITEGGCVVMGRGTYESIGGPLPKRINLVLSKNLYFSAEGVTVVHGLDASLAFASFMHYNDVFIIGGESVYKSALDQDVAQKMYITWVDLKPNGDRRFPRFNAEFWSAKWSEKMHYMNSKRIPIYFQYCEYTRNR